MELFAFHLSKLEPVEGVTPEEFIESLIAAVHHELPGEYPEKRYALVRDEVTTIRRRFWIWKKSGIGWLASLLATFVKGSDAYSTAYYSAQASLYRLST